MARRRHRSNERTPHPSDALAASSRRPKRADTRRSKRAATGGGPDAGDPVTPASSHSEPTPLAGAPLGAPNPLAHAAPDAEVAAAQMALGTEEVDVPAEEELAELATNGRAVVRGGGEAAAARPARRASILQRLITFLQGSWAELHRVQWPDRRQVLQATGVVIGFVIVAGVFLGLSDLASSHLMDWILK